MGDLVEAVHRESAEAIRHFWGVGSDTVWRWRKALGVGQYTEGTTKLKSEKGHGAGPLAGLAKAHAILSDPEREGARHDSIAVSKRGKARPPEVGQAIGRGHKGLTHTAEARRKMSEAHRRRGDGGAKSVSAHSD
jgi:hypothetical protein